LNHQLFDYDSKMSNLPLLLILAAALSLSACRSDKPDNPHARDNARKITRAAVPPEVIKSFNKDHPTVEVTWVNKQIQPSGAVHYEFKYTESDGRKGEAEYDDKGVPTHQKQTLR
jgi:hypothetical protein